MGELNFPSQKVTALKRLIIFLIKPSRHRDYVAGLFNHHRHDGVVF
jgi:hypothetical protein